MKLVAYLRVSTDRQAEAGSGLDVQQAGITEWARSHGHRVVRWHRDAGLSGSNGLDAREALPEALDAIRAGLAEGLVVWRLDRLSREVVLQETLLAEVRKMGGQVLSTSDTEARLLDDDEADPARRLMRVILGAVNEYERSMIRLRMRMGRVRKAASGGYAGLGSPPLGLRAVDGELEAHPTEIETVSRIIDLHSTGASLREIGATLQAEGHRTKRGGLRWHPTTIARVLRRAEQMASV